MSERLTVVFDDSALYRRLKVAAAERREPVKRIIEEAVAAYLGPEIAVPQAFDWAAFEAWQAEGDMLAADLPDDGVSDLSNVKRYLYEVSEHRPAVRRVAEGRTPYNAK